MLCGRALIEKICQIINGKIFLKTEKKWKNVLSVRLKEFGLVVIYKRGSTLTIQCLSGQPEQLSEDQIVSLTEVKY